MTERFYLYCRRDPDPEAGLDRRGWFFGEELKGRNVTGRPRYVTEDEARWLGPRLAREERCEVKAQVHGAVVGRGTYSTSPAGYITVACWRYNASDDTVETIQPWEGTVDAKGQQQCKNVSDYPPPTAGGSSVSAGGAGER